MLILHSSLLRNAVCFILCIAVAFHDFTYFHYLWFIYALLHLAVTVGYHSKLKGLLNCMNSVNVVAQTVQSLIKC